MATKVHADAILMSVSELKKSPTQAIDNVQHATNPPIYILNRNEPVANLVSTSYVERKEILEEENSNLTDLVNEQAYQIIALQRLLNDNGERLSDSEVRGDAVNTDLSEIEDEWS